MKNQAADSAIGKNLGNIHIANPCRADWNRMQGDDRVRFCGTCAKNVYNLSVMTREEAQTLINEKEGKMCARFYRRADGTVMTADCPVPTRNTRRPFQWLLAGIAALLAIGTAKDQAEGETPQTPPDDPGVDQGDVAFVIPPQAPEAPQE